VSQVIKWKTLALLGRWEILVAQFKVGAVAQFRVGGDNIRSIGCGTFD
jgi:hypothetical protein